MTTASPEVLLGVMVILGVIGIGLTVWLLRYALRGQQKKKVAETPPSPSADEQAPEPDSTVTSETSAEPVSPSPSVETRAAQQIAAVTPEALAEPGSPLPPAVEPAHEPTAAPTPSVQQRAYPHVIKMLNYANGKRNAFAIVS